MSNSRQTTCHISSCLWVFFIKTEVATGLILWEGCMTKLAIACLVSQDN